jgi:hypothetical protein
MSACFVALGVPLPSPVPVPGIEDLDLADPAGDGPLVSDIAWIGTCGCMAPFGGFTVAMRISFSWVRALAPVYILAAIKTPTLGRAEVAVCPLGDIY